jgi:hypothetical protein
MPQGLMIFRGASHAQLHSTCMDTVVLVRTAEPLLAEPQGLPVKVRPKGMM